MTKKTWIQNIKRLVPAVCIGMLGFSTPVRAVDDVLAEAAASIGNSLDGINPQDPRVAWFRDAKYGMFVHWGIFAVTAGEWEGKSTGFAEYVKWKLKVPAAEYAAVAQKFNPTQFDADQWAQLAKDAGMKYLVITAKHHDGFAMFASQASPFNVVDATPWKRDPMKELAAACAKRGIKFCFYYSHAADWNEPDAGGANTLDFSTDPDKRDFDAYFNRKAIPQVQELLSNYGEIGYLWFDWPTPYMTPERATRMASAIRQLQPNTLVNSRLGPKEPKKFKDLKKVAWDIKSMGDNQVPPAVVPGVWETAATLNEAWGYTNKEKNKAKPAKEVCFSLVDAVSKGGNYLLNVGPDSSGVIPEPQQQSLREVGAWLQTNGEAIYGAGPTVFGSEFEAVIVPGKTDKSGKPLTEPKKDWRCTTKPGKLYLHFFQWPREGHFELPPVKGTVAKAYLLSDKSTNLDLRQQGDTLRVALPAQAPASALATVLVLEISEEGAP